MGGGPTEQNAKVDLRGKALRTALNRIFQKVLSNDPALAVAFSLSELFQMREDALHQHGFEDIYKCGAPILLWVFNFAPHQHGIEDICKCEYIFKKVQNNSLPLFCYGFSILRPTNTASETSPPNAGHLCGGESAAVVGKGPLQ